MTQTCNRSYYCYQIDRMTSTRLPVNTCCGMCWNQTTFNTFEKITAMNCPFDCALFVCTDCGIGFPEDIYVIHTRNRCPMSQRNQSNIDITIPKKVELPTDKKETKVDREAELARSMSLLPRRVPPMIPTPAAKLRPKTERVKHDISAGQWSAWNAIESITQHEFLIDCRPDFLRNNGISGRQATGQNLELDIYSPELGIAVEYNGRQHYEYVPEMHASKDDFVRQCEYDEWKRRRCDEMRIYLIEVPYIVPMDDMFTFIGHKVRIIYSLPK